MSSPYHNVRKSAIEILSCLKSNHEHENSISSNTTLPIEFIDVFMDTYTQHWGLLPTYIVSY